MKTVLLLGLMLGADAYEANFLRGSAAYEAGDYPAAIHAYQQLVDSNVVDPVVFYNLGNAYFRNGDLGRAIANYERALQLEPGMDAAKHNLANALRLTERSLARPRPPEWQQALFFWHDGLAPGTVRRAALGLWVLFWAMLALRLWRPLPYLRLGAGGVLALAMLFGASSWIKASPTPLAVAVADTVPVRFGTSEAETVRFELHAGDRVLVDRIEDAWMRVTTAGGERGWARAEDLELVGPPYSITRSAARAANRSTSP